MLANPYLDLKNLWKKIIIYRVYENGVIVLWIIFCSKYNQVAKRSFTRLNFFGEVAKPKPENMEASLEKSSNEVPTRRKFVETRYTKGKPYPVSWCVNDDGSIASITVGAPLTEEGEEERLRYIKDKNHKDAQEI